MVLLDNKGNTLTEALCMGVEASLFHYLRAICPPGGDADG